MILTLLTAAALAGPAELAAATPDAFVVAVPEALRAPALVLSEAAGEALRQRHWDTALDAVRAMDADGLAGPQRADLAFVEAWAAVHAGRAGEVAHHLTLLSLGGTAPSPYRALVRGEILHAIGRDVDALAALDGVGEAAIAPRAQVQRAEILRELGRTAEASAIYEDMVSRDDPADGNALALFALATRRGPGSDAALPLLRRLWTWYPGTEQGMTARDLLHERHPDDVPTWQQIVRRSERLMALGSWRSALALSEPVAEHASEASLHGCVLAYLRGRSWYKLNQLSRAVEAFGAAGTRCAGVEGADGHKILYLQGQAEFRRGRFEASADAYTLLAERYAETSYADDGLTRAGIAWLEAGEDEAALAAWRRALDDLPDGDTVPEATFRLAFGLYERGRTEEAIEAADRLAALPLSADEVHVLAGRYWAARWRLYGDVTEPNRETSHPAEAVARWAALVEQAPHHYYGALAFTRLRIHAPDQADALSARQPPVAASTWHVRPAFLAHPAVVDALGLMRLGLVPEALTALQAIDLEEVLPDEMAWLSELRAATGDWLLAHHELHRWLRKRPLGTLGEREAAIVRLAFPDRYWTEVQEAAEAHGFDPRLFHALVREESTFNRRIVSFAGARGLSQLMPATARGVARAMGVNVTNEDLFDPATNLSIGARYLRDVLAQKEGNPVLALGSYNAGPGRITQWVRERGNAPLDEFVERVPFRETRGYMRRVTSTWQTMRWYFDRERPAFVELDAFVEAVLPSRAMATP